MHQLYAFTSDKCIRILNPRAHSPASVAPRLIHRHFICSYMRMFSTWDAAAAKTTAATEAAARQFLDIEHSSYLKKQH